jgi:uncharacterized protein (TIGR03435 family)
MISSWSRLSVFVLACVLAGSHLAAAPQDRSSAPLHFEVATIKPSQALSGATGDCYNPGVDLTNGAKDNLIPRGRCLIHSATLRRLIGYAYHIPATRLSGGPVWADEVRFDVDAKAEDATATHAELSAMLQTLLTDRFKLRFRRETKDIPGYALRVASNGAKLRASTRADDVSSIKVQVARGSKRTESADALNKLTAQKTSMAQFASALTYLPGIATAPVINETGVPGFYNFEFSWEPGESLSSVLQRQLGLRLVAQKVPADYFVIESAEKPSEN